MNLCLRPDGTADREMWHALHHTDSLDDALALREMSEVGRSWQHAGRKNEAKISEIRAARKQKA